MGGITFLPFVRDSKNAPAIPAAVSTSSAPKAKAEKPVKEKEATKAAPAAAAPSAAAPTKDEVKTQTAPAATQAASPEIEKLNNDILQKGNEVRDAKAAKVICTLIIAIT
jgi:hypothetical protein